MILKDIGITINLTEMPEHKEYAEYYLNRNRLMRFLLRTFKWTKVKELQFRVQCALLNATLEKGNEWVLTQEEFDNIYNEEYKDVMDSA